MRNPWCAEHGIAETIGARDCAVGENPLPRRQMRPDVTVNQYGRRERCELEDHGRANRDEKSRYASGGYSANDEGHVTREHRSAGVKLEQTPELKPARPTIEIRKPIVSLKCPPPKGSDPTPHPHSEKRRHHHRTQR